jgi:hypothetical protein
MLRKVMDDRGGLVIAGWVPLDPADTGVIEKPEKQQSLNTLLNCVVKQWPP